MSPEEISRYRSKATTVVTAWQNVLGESPTRHALALVMAVADFETRLGDARGMWKGEHNWGAIHKRAVTGDEASILLGHGVFPTDDQSLLTARGLLAAGPNEALHIDHNHVGAYFVWFWAFESDVEGAAKYLEVLVRNRSTVRAILDTASATDLAAALYATHYFEGFHKAAQENIREYAARVEERLARVESALLGWPQGSSAPSPPARFDVPGAQPTARPTESRGGWWLAGLALLGLGAIVLGRRS